MLRHVVYRSDQHGTPTIDTLLTDNATTVSKKAKKYHKENDVTDVALFDWNKMVLFDFDGMAEDAETPKLARAIWFAEEGQNHKGYETFRSVLPGFLLRALERHGLV